MTAIGGDGEQTGTECTMGDGLREEGYRTNAPGDGIEGGERLKPTGDERFRRALGATVAANEADRLASLAVVTFEDALRAAEAGLGDARRDRNHTLTEAGDREERLVDAFGQYFRAIPDQTPERQLEFAAIWQTVLNTVGNRRYPDSFDRVFEADMKAFEALMGQNPEILVLSEIHGLGKSIPEGTYSQELGPVRLQLKHSFQDNRTGKALQVLFTGAISDEMMLDYGYGPSTSLSGLSERIAVGTRDLQTP